MALSSLGLTVHRGLLVSYVRDGVKCALHKTQRRRRRISSKFQFQSRNGETTIGPGNPLHALSLPNLPRTEHESLIYPDAKLCQDECSAGYGGF